MDDAVIVGGGPAGLSAALILGRCRRKVLLCDAGEPRNRRSRSLHGFLTRDGIPPLEFLRLGREDLRTYPTVEVLDVRVADISRGPGRFEVLLADGIRRSARKVLLATGVVDRLPPVGGLDRLYGRGIHHCPYCDGFEPAGRRLAVYGAGDRGYGVALELLGWSRDVVLFTDGPPGLPPESLNRLARNGIALRPERIERLLGEERLEAVLLAGGEEVPREALFFSLGQEPRSSLAERLGCAFNPKGTVETGWCESTDVPGVFVAGDASRDVQFAIVAAAEGAKAAVAIHRSLLEEELR